MRAPNYIQVLPDGAIAIELLYRRNILCCILDAADYPLVKEYHWHARKSCGLTYAVTNAMAKGKRTLVHLHKIITGSDNMDHRDRDGLNNRRINLRLATHSQQMANRKKFKNGKTSKFKGVTKLKECGLFRARLGFEGKRIYLGEFRKERDAAKAYDIAAKRYFGEFAVLNFPK